MDSNAEITPAKPEHLNAVLTLLTAVSLPREGVLEHFPHFLVAHEGSRLVGVVGLEPYGPSALLRSLAVAPAYRGQGLARALTAKAIQAAREQGITQIFLLTESAPEFFRSSASGASRERRWMQRSRNRRSFGSAVANLPSVCAVIWLKDSAGAIRCRRGFPEETLTSFCDRHIFRHMANYRR